MKSEGHYKDEDRNLAAVLQEQFQRIHAEEAHRAKHGGPIRTDVRDMSTLYLSPTQAAQVLRVLDDDTEPSPALIAAAKRLDDE